MADVLAEPGLVWIAAGLVMLVAEILAPGLFLVWLGLAAIGTGLVSHVVQPTFGAEVAIFAVLAAIAILAGLRLRKSVPRSRLNTASSGLIGRTATALVFNGAEGRVRVGDSDWPARMASAEVGPAPGTRLAVDGLDGMVLIVSRSDHLVS